jgi:hypothetical protein
MINLSKSGDTIVFEFINNGHYLENGTIEVPVNSLSLVTDSSNMATFYKADSHDIFISATYDELGKTKAEMLEWFEENMVGGGGIDSGAVQTQIDQSISGFADSVLYNSTSKYVEFYHGGTGGTKVYEFDASDFVIDGMIDDVRIETISGVSYLVIDFNTASGKEDIQIPLTDIFDPSTYYTKTEVDGIVSGKTSVVNLTKAEYDALVTGGTVDPTVLYNITDATPIDMSQYWTSAETNSAITQAVSGKADTSYVDQSVSGKQDTLISGTNIKTINNESILGSGNIDIQGGGGKAISGGTNISITTGETADTINCTLPIIKGVSTGPFPTNHSVMIGYDGNQFSYFINKDYSASIGFTNYINGERSVCLGDSNYANGYCSVAVNAVNTAATNYSFACGNYSKTSNQYEFASGRYNNSVSGSSSFGDSGNTLFSVGNGTADNARHNAFEIRQNGDIYYFDGTNDVKLQDKFSSLDTTIGNINSVLNSI